MHSCPRAPPPAAAPPLPRPTQPRHAARPCRLHCFAPAAGAGSVRRMQWPTAPVCTADWSATLHAVGTLPKGAASTRCLGGCESAFVARSQLSRRAGEVQTETSSFTLRYSVRACDGISASCGFFWQGSHFRLILLRLHCLPFAVQVDLLLQVGLPFVLQVDSCFRIVSPSLFTYLLVGADLDENGPRR